MLWFTRGTNRELEMKIGGPGGRHFPRAGTEQRGVLGMAVDSRSVMGNVRGTVVIAGNQPKN